MRAQLDRELIDKEGEIDKKLDTLNMERRQLRQMADSNREEATVAIKDVEKLKQEKQLLLEEIKKKERELEYFQKQFCQYHLENEELKTKEKELQEAKAKLEEKEKQLERYKEKKQKLKEKIEEGVRELGVREGMITQLEKDKAKVAADLESERMKVRVFHACIRHLVDI